MGISAIILSGTEIVERSTKGIPNIADLALVKSKSDTTLRSFMIASSVLFVLLLSKRTFLTVSSLTRLFS